MSILIKGVSLKDFKPICPCMNGEYGNCDVPWVRRCYGIGKDGCPLVEIPPHGRLIDADALIEKLNALPHRHDTKMVGMVTNEELYDAIVYDLTKEPTIIPAEEGE